MSDVKKGEADYSYNGMGKRVAVVRPDEKIEYLLDLTKDYHNMLERSVNGDVETYTYDANVVSMSKRGEDYFYMLDELGSGMYLTGTDGASVSTYAYDEFGRNIDPFTGKKQKPSYTKQGNIIQPLAFTGYQNDEMTDNYFAQARYYNSEAGRFVSEDKIRGFIDSPETINHYLYCWGNPTKLIDLDGNSPILVTTPMFTGPNIELNTYVEGFDDVINTVSNTVDDIGDWVKEKAEKLEDVDRPIIVVGGSGSIGSGGYLFGGAQVVFDPVKVITDPAHALGIQGVGGTGLEASVGSVKGTIYVGGYWSKDISYLEGFGTEIGGSGGEAVVVGGGMWRSGEENDSVHKYGGYVCFGVGANGNVAEGHVSLSGTTPTFYPVDFIMERIEDLCTE